MKPEVIRLDLDLLDDGKLTVFLTYKGTGSRSGANWTAYVPVENGYARTNGIQFREDLVRPGKLEDLNPMGGLLILYPAKGGGNLFRNTISDSGALLPGEEIMQIDYSNKEHQKLYERVFRRKFGEPMPDEFFTNPTHKIIPVAEILARPQASQQQKSPPVVKTDVESVTTSEVEPETPNKSSEPQHLGSRTERNSFLFMLLPAVLIVLILGLLCVCFALKNRKSSSATK